MMATYLKNDRIAASLVLRLRALLPREVSTKSRNLPTRSASMSVTRRSVDWRPRRFRSEDQQQSEGVAIACHRVGAGGELACEAFGEEALHEDGERVGRHDPSPSSKDRSARSLASCSSSGTASMYQ